MFARYVQICLRCALATALLVGVTDAALVAQYPLLTQYNISSWDQRHGLPQNSAAAIASGSEGYIWVGTQEGVARFDGFRFTTFNRSNTEVLLTNDISTLLTDDEGNIWIGTSGGGVVRYNGEQFEAYPNLSGVQQGTVTAMAQDSSGAMWVGTGDGLRLVDNGRLVPFGGAELGTVNVLARRRAGGAWVGTETGELYSVDAGGLSFVTELPGEAILALQEDREGVWIGTRTGLFRKREATVEPVSLLNPPSDVYVRVLLLDRRGSLWIGTRGQGLFRLTDRNVERLTITDGLPSDDIVSLLEDSDGRVWFGTSDGGLAVLQQGAFLPFTESEGLSGEVVLPILEDRSGTVWMGTYGQGLNRVEGTEVTSYREADGLADDFVLSLAATPDGSIWAGTRNGISRLLGDRFTTYGLEEGLGSATVPVLYTDPGGSLWAGTSAGLSRFDGDRFTTFTSADGLPSDLIQALLEDREGSLWVGTMQGLGRFRAGQFETFASVPGSPRGYVLAFHEDPTGDLWIGTNSGLKRFRNGEFQTVAMPDGLLGDQIFRILQDDLGYLWLSGNLGITRVALSELQAVADGRAETLPSFRHYTANDGLPSTETNGGIQPAGWKDREGRLWFPTIRGAALVDPSEIAERQQTAAPILERVLVNGQPVAFASDGPLRLPADLERLELEFTAFSFSEVPDVVFRYRLEGFEDAWIDAGVARTATYTNVPPGEYRFVVQARIRNQLWSDAVGLPIRANAYFYETWPFRLVLLVGVIGFAVALERERVRRHKERERSLVALVEEREKAERQYRELFENANDIVLTIDLDGRVTSINRKGEEVLGRRADKIIGRPLAGFVAPDFQQQVASWTGSDFQQLGKNEASVQELELIGGGNRRTLIEASTQAVLEGTRPIGVQAIMRDVSERRHLEEQLRQAQKMESVGRLAGGIAHDFNNLLSVIGGNAELALMDLPESAPVRQELEEIFQTAGRAAKLTHQLLAFSRQQILQPEVLDLNERISEITAMLSRVIGEDVEMITTLQADHPWIYADAGQIEQVLMNLAVNARDAMPRGGQLILKTQSVELSEGGVGGNPAGSYVLLSVADTGVGMDRETQERIFEPFFTTKAKGKGTGLGLSTVYGIVQQSGAYLILQSEPGSGSVFNIYFPAVTKEDEEKDLAPPEVALSEGGETILLVEDEDSLRLLTSRILRRLKYRVLAAPDGEAAVRLAENHPGKIDLVLTDVVMPGMSGREMADRLRRTQPDLRVLYMSGYTDDELLHHGMLQKEINFLHKPFSPDQLSQKIREVVSS